MNERRSENKKNSTKRNPWKWIAIGCFAVFALVMGITMLSQQPAIESGLKKLEEQNKTIEELNKTIEKLENELNYMGTDEYVERTARDRLGMVKEDEIIFKEKESDDKAA